MEPQQQSWGDWASSFFKPKEQEVVLTSPSGMSDIVEGGRRRRRAKTRRGGKGKSRKLRRSRK